MAKVSKKIIKDISLDNDKHKFLFKYLMDAFAYHRIVLNKVGKPVDYIFLEVNKTFEEYTGLKAKDIINQRVTKIIPGVRGSEPDLISIYGRVALTGVVESLEIFFAPFKKWYFIHVYSPEKGYFITIFHDITKSKEYEKEVAKYKFIVDQATQMVAVADLKGVVIHANNSWVKQHGYKNEKELIGRNLSIFHTKEQLLKVKEFIKKLLSIGRYSGEIGHVTKQGREFLTLMHNFVLNFDDKSNALLVGIATDITELSRVSGDLAASEEKFRKIFENSPLGIVIVDLDFKFINVSPYGCKMWGYTKKELLKKTFADITHPDEAERDLLQVRRVIKGEIPSYKVDKRYIKKDGSILWGTIAVSVVRNAEGQPVYLIAVVEDLTQRKQDEDALRLNELLLRGVNNNLQSAMIYQVTVSKDGSRKLTYASDSIRKFYGVSPEEGMKDVNHIYSRVYESDRLKLHQEEAKAIRKMSTFEAEARVVGPSGAIRWSYFVSVPTLLKNGETVWDGIEFDITDRKKIEENLQEQNSILEQSEIIASLGSYVLDIKNGTWIGSKMLDKIFGINNKYDHSVDGWSKLVFPEDRKMMDDYFAQEVLGKHVFFNKEYRIIRRTDKSVRWVHGLGRLEFDSQKAPIKMLGTIQDITEHKNIEEKLLESESRYRGIFQTSRDAVMTLEPPSWNFTSGNLATLKIFRADNEAQFLLYPPWKLSPKFQPDGRRSDEKAKEMIDLAMEKGSNLFEWTHKRMDGQEFFAEVFLSRVKLGENVFLQAIVRDISEQVKNKEKIENKTLDLIRMNKAMVGRELKMAQLKRELERLKKENKK